MLQQMDSIGKQLAEMLSKFNSRRKAKSYPGISFIRAYCVVSVCRKLSNAPGYVVKPTDENNSKHVCSVTRRFGLIGVFSAGPLDISDFSLAI